jgi:hypothetical protein
MGRSYRINKKQFGYVVVRYWILEKRWGLCVLRIESAYEILGSCMCAPSSSLAEDFIRFSGIHEKPNARLINSGSWRSPS